MKLPKCIICSNVIDDDENSKLTCRAFPDGIPDGEIWEPFDKECNDGIMFEE